MAHGGARLQGALLAFVGIGAFAGAIAVASIRRQNVQARPLILGAMAFGLALMGFALSHWVLLSIVLAAIVGVFSVTYQTQNQTMLQALAPPHLRGRVMSIYLLDRGFVPIGTLLAGFLASLYGGPGAVLVMSGASVAFVLLVVLLSPGFAKLKVELQTGAEAAPAHPYQVHD